MQVEGATGGHGPDDFGEHAEGDDHEEVGVECAELCQELGIAELLGLKERQRVLQCHFLDVALNELVASTGDLVGHGDDGGHVVAGVEDGL